MNQPGAIPPKVLKTIINEGSYSEDEIAVEYFGGVLASSRTESARDDRGARIAKALDNLSCYQLRCHYLIYSSIANVFKNQDQSLRVHDKRAKLELFIPLAGFASAMGLTQKEWDNPQFLSHIFQGLSSDGLISDQWAFGPVETLKKVSESSLVTMSGIVCTPTASGAELFLWGFGNGNHDLDYIFTNEFSSNIQGIPEIIEGSLSTKT